jgi:hypothetical protein
VLPFSISAFWVSGAPLFDQRLQAFARTDSSPLPGPSSSRRAGGRSFWSSVWSNRATTRRECGWTCSLSRSTSRGLRGSNQRRPRVLLAAKVTTGRSMSTRLAASLAVGGSPRRMEMPIDQLSSRIFSGGWTLWDGFQTLARRWQPSMTRGGASDGALRERGNGGAGRDTAPRQAAQRKGTAFKPYAAPTVAGGDRTVDPHVPRRCVDRDARPSVRGPQDYRDDHLDRAGVARRRMVRKMTDD